MERVSDWLARHAGERGAKVALRAGAWSLTYAELDERVRRLAAGLRHACGLTPGARVATLAGNSSEHLELLLACARLGALVTPLDASLPPPSRASRVIHSACTLLFAAPEYARLVPQTTHGTAIRETLRLGPGGETEGLIEAHPPDTAAAAGAESPWLIRYRGDTAVALSQADLAAATAPVATESDTGLSLIPLTAPGGLELLVLPLLRAGGTLLLPRSAEGAEALIRRHHVTLFAASPEADPVRLTGR